MPIGLLGALLGGASLFGALSRSRSSRAADRAAREGLEYQGLLLREYGLPYLREQAIPALRRRSELEEALWPYIREELLGSLDPSISISPSTQNLYRALRSNLLQEQDEARRRIAMDLAARGGIRSGAYPARLEALERDTTLSLSELYNELTRDDARRRQELALSLASRMFSSPFTPQDIGSLAGSMSLQGTRLSALQQARRSTLASSLGSLAEAILGRGTALY